MIFSYNWLQSYFDKKLPKPEKLAEILTMHAFEVEEVKKAGGPARNASQAKCSDAGGDWLLDIDVLSNRGPDCLSHIGIAREIAAITNYELRIARPHHYASEAKGCGRANYELGIRNKLQTKDFISIEVQDRNACPRYTARVITDVKVVESPKWMQERLKICGLRPINNIVDATNYVMLEIGQPLHAFDFDKIKGVNPKSQITNSKFTPTPKFGVGARIPNYKFQTKKIVIREAKKGEKIAALDDEEYDLDEDILVIADEKDVLAIAGIKGGRKAEIDKNTKTIILESANFHYQIIRKGSKKLGLKTDASWRFEQGLDPNLTETAINRAAVLIQEIAGGNVAQGFVDFYPKKVLPKKVKLDLDYVERLLGVKIPQKEIIRILKSLGLKIKNYKLKILNVGIPTFRRDISIPEDLIEEIGRLYGYDKIKPVFPEAALIPPKRNENIFWGDKMKNILKEAGFTEVYNYSFISHKQVLSSPPDFARRRSLWRAGKLQVSGLVEIENPMSVEQKYLRPSLIPNLLKNVRDNFKYFSEIRIFELGKIFAKKQRIASNEQTEKTMLCGVVAKKTAKDEFYEVKGVIDLLLNQLGISDVWYDDFQPTPEDSILEIWEPKKCAEIKIGGEEIGFLGEISPKIAVFDLDFEKLIKQCSEEQIYQPISKYPAIVRDLAILVPKEVKVVEILNQINIIGGKLVIDVDLFDMYEGEELPDGRKNLAFHIIYQAKDRTLTGQEVDKIQNKIIKILEEEPEWEVRR